jgi:hypothetical protein
MVLEDPVAEKEGREPDKIVNRINEIKWNVWNKPPENTFILEHLEIVGVTFNNHDCVSRQNILSHMERWEAVDIVRDLTNKHSSSAISVVGGMGVIGHLSEEYAIPLSSLMDKGASAIAKVSGLYGGVNGKHYGAAVEIHFNLLENMFCFDAKVVGIKGDNKEGLARADIAEGLEVGKMVFFDYDDYDEKDRVFVEVAIGGDFGKLSSKEGKKIIQLLREGYRYLAIVSDVEDGAVYLSVCLWER